MAGTLNCSSHLNDILLWKLTYIPSKPRNLRNMMQNSNDDSIGDSTGQTDDNFRVSDALGLFYCNSRSLLPKIDELR